MNILAKTIQNSIFLDFMLSVLKVNNKDYISAIKLITEVDRRKKY